MGHVVGTNFEWRKIPNTVTYGVPIHVVLSTPPGDFRKTTYVRKTVSGLFRIQSSYGLMGLLKSIYQLPLLVLSV